MSEPRIIRLIGPVGFEDLTSAPTWLASFDVDAHDGLGRVNGTRHRHEAMRFTDMRAAFEAYRTQSRVRPLRPDGKPNRPLTAYTIEIEPE